MFERECSVGVLVHRPGSLPESIEAVAGRNTKKSERVKTRLEDMV